jgi:uncharacterized Zn-finger protein
MGKFKNWLIHKLGGYTKEEFIIPSVKSVPILKIRNRKVQKICSQAKRFFTPRQMSQYKNEIEDVLKNDLLNITIEALKRDYKPKVMFHFDEEPEMVCVYCEMVFEYVESENEVEEDEN